MAVLFEEFCKLSLQERRECFGIQVEMCSDCGVVLQETITGRNPSPKGYLCERCSIESFGDIIEKYPILPGGHHRIKTLESQ